MADLQVRERDEVLLKSWECRKTCFKKTLKVSRQTWWPASPWFCRKIVQVLTWTLVTDLLWNYREVFLLHSKKESGIFCVSLLVSSCLHEFSADAQVSSCRPRAFLIGWLLPLHVCSPEYEQWTCTGFKMEWEQLYKTQSMLGRGTSGTKLVHFFIFFPVIASFSGNEILCAKYWQTIKKRRRK